MNLLTKPLAEIDPLQLFTLNEVSEALGVCKETLRRWDNGGKLKAIRVGDRRDRRYRLKELNEFLCDLLK